MLSLPAGGGVAESGTLGLGGAAGDGGGQALQIHVLFYW